MQVMQVVRSLQVVEQFDSPVAWLADGSFKNVFESQEREIRQKGDRKM